LIGNCKLKIEKFFMHTIKDILSEYQTEIDALDLELLIASAIKKPREFVLAHPEYKLTEYQVSSIKYLVYKRAEGKPLAYLLGYKEFYGLKFKVNKNVLIPRPETELLVESVLREMQNTKYLIQNTTVIDVGTGSGNIIISIGKTLADCGLQITDYRFLGIDISSKAVAVARQNAKFHKVNKKIGFLKGNLLEPILKNTKYQILNTNYIIIANLPYLSKNIYTAAPASVRKFEPRAALLSGRNGLTHYEKLMRHIKVLKSRCSMLHVSCFMEISPKQKNSLQKLLKVVLSGAKISFQKDLSGRWRICQISLN
jgi:release factor glutamine methyltransferase